MQRGGVDFAIVCQGYPSCHTRNAFVQDRRIQHACKVRVDVRMATTVNRGVGRQFDQVIAQSLMYHTTWVEMLALVDWVNVVVVCVSNDVDVPHVVRRYIVVKAKCWRPIDRMCQ